MSAGAISGTTSLPSSTSGTSTTATDPYANMTSSDFMKVMLSELEHQNPTQPTNTTQIMQQLSSLRNIESQLSLQQNLQSLVAQNQIAQASGMIGKLVGGMDSNGNKISGHVMSVQVVKGQAMLELDSGQQLSMANVTSIQKA